jgi:putative Mg2+ transporter-C (MgtC) family protein
VVSGIGFLGAGLIFVKKDFVRGLTTAAGIWLSAAIGLAAGAGMLLLAIFTGVIALTAIYGLELVEDYLIHSKKSLVNMTLMCEDKQGVVAQVSTTIADAGFKIENIILNRRSLAPGTLEIKFDLSGVGDIQVLLMRLGEVECVTEISECESNYHKTIGI